MITAQRLETILKIDKGERRWYELAAYIVAIVLCLTILGELLNLRQTDLTTPLTYYGDGLFYSVMTKATITNGWWLTNDSLGAPHGQEMYDFPQNDCFSYLLIKVMGLFTSNWATVFNLFYLISFPLTTIGSFYVLRKFNVSRAPAIMASLLYSFTCPHFAPGQYHLMYCVFFPVPLIIMVILWVCSEQLSLTKTEDGRTRLDLRNRKLIASLLICVLIASTGGAYYSFFAVCLLASATLFLVIRHKNYIKPLTPVFLIVVISGAFLANQTPYLLYTFKHGKTNVAIREAWEADHYGLKIGQLLLPLSAHRIKAFAKFKERYDKSPPSEGENVVTSPGFIGSFGFLFLIGWLLYRRGRDETDRPSVLFNHMSMLNATAVLIATVGGFGSLFAHLVSPQIRGYARMNIYISFLAFFTSALLLDLLARRFFQTRPRKVVFYILIPLLTIVGVLDETRKLNLPEVKAEFMNDRDFFREIESAMPERAMIFQLPFETFPERNYDHLRGYLHSDKLRWSFGAMRGRYSANWHEMISKLPTEEMIKTVAIAGFSGVYIDREQYPDKGAKIESEISSLLRSSPLVSHNQRLLFFNLTEYRKTISGDPEKVLNPLIAQWRKDFSALEGSPVDNWRWCSTNGELIIENRLSRERDVVIEMGASSINEGYLRIESRNFSEQIRISSTNTPFSKKFTIPPGEYLIRFTSTAPAVTPLPDIRLLSFRINNFKMTESK
jgi:phosphoglycerol transferase